MPANCRWHSAHNSCRKRSGHAGGPLLRARRRRTRQELYIGIYEFELDESEMSREAAKKIIELMVKHGAEQNAVLGDIRSICARDEFKTTNAGSENPWAACCWTSSIRSLNARGIPT
jgi:hypothetical protein